MSDPASLRSSLLDDLAHWSTAVALAPMNKHASQVSGLVAQLSAALDEEVPPSAPASNELEHSVLDFHHVWDFFRAKLTLRYVPWYGDPLAVADDLAWAAFRPVRDAFRAGHGRELREPPLVYLSRGYRPFSVTRGEDYTGLLRGGLWTESADSVARCLVVPVVSLPWHQFTSPAVMLSVAHEVGHVVAGDLNLLPALRQRLAALPLSAHFLPGWLEEAFADVFAATVCGCAVALALDSQLSETVSPDYPPASTRQRLVTEVARRRADLTGIVLPPVDPADSVRDADITAVVSAFLDPGLPGLDAGLGALFPVVDGDHLLDDIDRLSRGRDSQAQSVPALLAAATVAAASADQQALSAHVRIKAGLLRETARRAVPAESDALVRERDLAAGARLARLMRRSDISWA